jgi:hypothetical protein
MKHINFWVIPIGKLDRVLVNHICYVITIHYTASILKFIYSLFITFNSFDYDTPSGGIEVSIKNKYKFKQNMWAKEHQIDDTSYTNVD